MKVLLDVGVSPRLRQPLQQHLDGVVVESAVFHNWRSLRDDELLAVAERGGFTTLVRTLTRITLSRAERTIPQKRAPPDFSWQLHLYHCPKP